MASDEYQDLDTDDLADGVLSIIERGETVGADFTMQACELARRVKAGDFPLDGERVYWQAHREWEIAKLMGASDEYEQAWLDYCGALVRMTDVYLQRVRKGVRHGEEVVGG